MLTFNVVFASGKELSFKANEVTFYNPQTMLNVLVDMVGGEALNIKRYYYSSNSEIGKCVADYLNGQFVSFHDSELNNVTEAQLKFFYSLCGRSDAELYSILSKIEKHPLTLSLISDFI